MLPKRNSDYFFDRFVNRYIINKHNQGFTKMIAIQNVSKSFTQGSLNYTLFEEVSHQFIQGKSYAVMGSSGSGKSTLLHLLMGIENPTSGSIIIEGINIVAVAQKEKDVLRQAMGIMFQTPYLVSELTVIENVMLKSILFGAVSKTEIDRAQALLKSVGLEKKESMQPLLLSGGEQQRVALLRALFHPPQWLLVDEPTGSLDEDSGREILKILKQYQSLYNMGIIMTTHDRQVAEHMDQIIEIKDKKLKAILKIKGDVCLEKF
jgi:ABC-type lipoprotein export system ATPase subunit